MSLQRTVKKALFQVLYASTRMLQVYVFGLVFINQEGAGNYILMKLAEDIELEGAVTIIENTNAKG